MHSIPFDDVYDTLLGEIHGEDAVAGVENAYADGSECDRLYNDVMAAYDRLREKLGIPDEDPDVERIIDNLLSIQRILCRHAYHYGQTL